MIYVGAFLRYSSALFLIGDGLIIYAIVVKNGFLYRVGFYLYLGYALIVMAYDVLIILFILVFLDWYEKLIGVTLSIPEDEDGSTKEAKNIVGFIGI